MTTPPGRLVWENEVGGRTFEVGADGDRVFLKWSPRSTGIDLAGEAARMRWAAPWTPVPRVVADGDDDEATWMVTKALPGTMAVADRWKADPGTAVTAIGRGLRRLHDEVPVAGCPFSWSVEDRLADARRRAAAGRIDPARWHEDHHHLDVDGALAVLADPPPVTRLVVCHGDACAPNTLIHEDGSFAGHVDLGDLGVADPWADLAVATWSAGWNYGPGWEEVLLDAYGIAPDPERTSYYRLLYDLGP
jgi:kanamycin kinase